MNILIISSNYPTLKKPHHGAFVYNLAQCFAINNKVTIISPMKAHDFIKPNVTTSYGNESCYILQPKYFSFSNKNILGFNTGKLSDAFFSTAVKKALRRLTDQPDVIYCHFLHNALPVLGYAKENNIPIVVASGESSYNSWKKRPAESLDKIKKQIDHIICVSHSNQASLLELGFDKNKMSVIPNAVDYARFKPLDSTACKKKLGFTDDDFVVGFIGHFIHRKGPNRLISAIKLLNDKNIKLVCLGSGGELDANEFTLVLPPMPNEQLPDIYNAFDVFVLPTLNEGHCNVIEEAKGCGVPVISSQGTSVELQLSSEQGILVNPSDIQAIADAIAELKNNPSKLNNFRKNLVNGNRDYDIEKRSEKILGILAAQL